MGQLKHVDLSLECVAKILMSAILRVQAGFILGDLKINLQTDRLKDHSVENKWGAEFRDSVHDHNVQWRSCQGLHWAA